MLSTVIVSVDKSIRYVEVMQFVRYGWMISRISPDVIRSYCSLRNSGDDRVSKRIRLDKLTGQIRADLEILSELELRVFIQACCDLYQDIVLGNDVLPQAPFPGSKLFVFAPQPAGISYELQNKYESNYHQSNLVQPEPTKQIEIAPSTAVPQVAQEPVVAKTEPLTAPTPIVSALKQSTVELPDTVLSVPEEAVIERPALQVGIELMARKVEVASEPFTADDYELDLSDIPAC
jgi:hypothetical protein